MNATTFGVAVVSTLLSLSTFAAESNAQSSDSFSAFQSPKAAFAFLRKATRGGAEIDRRDADGNTPLIEAAWVSDVATMKRLLKAGADVQATNSAGVSALHRAATSVEKTRLLLEAGALVQARTQLGNTPLMLAARKAGNVETVKLLLARGALVNVANVFGATPLMAAAAAQDLAIVETLLDHGAEVNVVPAMSGDGFIWGGGRSPLMWAAFHGNVPLVRLLLARGARVDLSGLAGDALIQASWGGQTAAARVLLDSGAKPTTTDLIANYTALHWAASSEHGSPELVQLLMERGAPVNAEGGQPVDNFLGKTETPLSLALKRGRTPIVAALLKAGAQEPKASALSAPRGQSSAPASPPSTVQEAIQRAIPALQRTAELSRPTFLRHASKQDCISCHQQQLPLTALSLAHSRKFAVDPAVLSHQLEFLRRDLSSVAVAPQVGPHTSHEMTLQATFHPEPAIFDGYTALPLSLNRDPITESTAALAHQLTVFQQADGHWSWNLPRPPIQGSDVAATALAVVTLKTYGDFPGVQHSRPQLNLARAWLRSVRPESLEDFAYQLLGLSWCGEKPRSLKSEIDALRKLQRENGGWAQLNGLESDAYATGQALYALLEGGRVSSADSTIQRGIQFLLRSQTSEGTWHVRRRAHPFQPPMENHFAHGADGWISSAGSSWAVMALARSLNPSSSTPSRTSTWSPVSSVSTPGSGASSANAQSSANPGSIDFAKEIRPILERSCVACHSGERPKGGFSLQNRAALLRGGARGEPVLIPGKPEASSLFHAVSDRVEDLEMPPLNKRDQFPALNKNELKTLSDWITAGAPWPPEISLQPASKGPAR